MSLNINQMPCVEMELCSEWEMFKTEPNGFGYISEKLNSDHL